jgi:hypothetical protein
MSGETEQNVSSWTTDTLHVHMTTLLEAAWREMALIRDRMEHDFRLQDERMARQWGEQDQRTRIALDAHETALNVQRETSLRETAIAAKTAKDAVDAALAAQKESVGVQADTLKQYRETQNEWRGSLGDLSARMMPRSEAEAAVQRATERIQELVLAMASMPTRLELETARQADQARITELTTRVTRAEALAAGSEAKTKSIYAVMGVAVSVLIAAIALFNFLSAR